MKQCEIWNANLNPIRGSEQAGFRPVVIISGNLLNANTRIVIACPLTSKLKNYHGNVILKPNVKNGLSKKSEILTFHVRSISKERLVERVGSISKEEFEQIKTCLGDILRY